MSEPQQHDKPPELHVLNPRTMTFADAIEMFRRLSGREPTPEEVEGARAEWEALPLSRTNASIVVGSVLLIQSCSVMALPLAEKPAEAGDLVVDLLDLAGPAAGETLNSGTP